MLSFPLASYILCYFVLVCFLVLAVYDLHVMSMLFMLFFFYSVVFMYSVLLFAFYFCRFTKNFVGLAYVVFLVSELVLVLIAKAR